MDTLIGTDRNGNPINLGDRVRVFTKHNSKVPIYMGTIISTPGGWIYVKIKIPKQLDSLVFPFTNTMTTYSPIYGIKTHEIEFELME